MKPLKNDVPFKRGDFLKVVLPTNFHTVGEIVFVDDTDWYGVILRGKPGHYHSDSFKKADHEDIAAAFATNPNP